MNLMYFDGAPCAVKAACTVLAGGKDGDHIKILPIGTKMIDFGALPNNTYKSVKHGTTVTRCVRHNLVNKYSSLMLNGHRNIIVDVDAANVQITTNTDLSAHQAFCFIWYTKD